MLYKNKSNNKINNNNSNIDIIEPKLHINKNQLNWNFNLHVFPSTNNNKKILPYFSLPSFYFDDLNKYKKILNNNKKV